MDRKPTDLELQVLGVLWDHGPLPVRDVMSKLPDGKNRAYTTVLSVLQGMEQKGLVTFTREGLAHIYAPAVQREEIVQPVLQTLIRNLFGGNPAKVVQSLMQAESITQDELKEIQAAINKAKSQRKK